jgi:hypothetical protein
VVPTGARAVPTDLVDAALQALQDAERVVVPGTTDRRRYLRDGATLWDPADDRIDATQLADRALRAERRSSEPDRRRSRADRHRSEADRRSSRADRRSSVADRRSSEADRRSSEAERRFALRSAIVRLGELPSPDKLEVRSYLHVDGELCSLKVWSGSTASRTGARERDIRLRIADIEGYRTPRILAHGTLGETTFLLEPVVLGRHPSSGAERVAMADDLGRALTAGYAATDAGDRRLSAVTHPSLAPRLEGVLTDTAYPWPDDAPARPRLWKGIAKLIHRDERLPTAVTHNALVASNVIRDASGRHHLVDWGHGRRGPAAFDLLKLVLYSGDDDAALAALMPHLAPLAGRGWRRYRLPQQFALGVAQTLSWAPGARERAERAGRLDRFDDEHRRRVRWLGRWLEA